MPWSPGAPPAVAGKAGKASASYGTAQLGISPGVDLGAAPIMTGGSLSLREKNPVVQTCVQSLHLLQWFTEAMGSGSKGAVVRTPPRKREPPYFSVTMLPDYPMCPRPAATAP